MYGIAIRFCLSTGILRSGGNWKISEVVLHGDAKSTDVNWLAKFCMLWAHNVEQLLCVTVNTFRATDEGEW